jgi:hypothetical protein
MTAEPSPIRWMRETRWTLLEREVLDFPESPVALQHDTENKQKI